MVTRLEHSTPGLNGYSYSLLSHVASKAYQLRPQRGSRFWSRTSRVVSLLVAGCMVLRLGLCLGWLGSHQVEVGRPGIQPDARIAVWRRRMPVVA